MRIDSLTLEVRDSDLVRLGQINISDVTFKSWSHHNNIGTWSLTIDKDDRMIPHLLEPGAGIILTHDFLDSAGQSKSVVLFSGIVDVQGDKQSIDDLTGTVTLNGYDDNIVLADALAWPDPGSSDVSLQSASHHILTGNCEAVMRGYVGANIADSATPSRRIANLKLDTNYNRGGMVTGRARFDKLGMLLGELAAVSEMGFRVVLEDSWRVFKVYEPRDLRKLIRMDLANDTLEQVTSTTAGPKATRVIVAGKGEGEERTFVMVTDSESVASEASWGRKIEVFRDRRDTEEVSELIQSGMEILVENGRVTSSLKIKPVDDLQMSYGQDWFLGDQVTVVVGDQELSAVVKSAAIEIDIDGVRIGAVAGDPEGFDFQTQMIQKQKSTEKRLAFLERNAEATSPDPEASAQPGDVKFTARATAPTGWLVCDGRVLLRSDYSALFDAIGTAYNIGGELSTQFRIPNTNGRVPVGQDTAQTEFNVIGETGGAKTHTLTAAQIPPHSHPLTYNNSNLGSGGSLFGGSAFGSNVNWLLGNSAYAANPGNALRVGNNTGGGAHNNLQPYIVMLCVIKT